MHIKREAVVKVKVQSDDQRGVEALRERLFDRDTDVGATRVHLTLAQTAGISIPRVYRQSCEDSCVRETCCPVGVEGQRSEWRDCLTSESCKQYIGQKRKKGGNFHQRFYNTFH